MKCENGSIGVGELIQISGLKKKYISSLCGNIPPSRLSEYFTASRPLTEDKLEILRDVLINCDLWSRKQVDSALHQTNTYFEDKKI